MQTLLCWSANGDLLRVWEVPTGAAREWVESKLSEYWDQRTVRAELKDRREVVAVYERNQAGEIIKTADENGDTDMAEEAAEQTEEAPAEKKPKKWEVALEHLQGPGISLAALAEEVGVNEKAARSLIADVKRMGHTVEREKGEDNVSYYRVAD